MKRLLFSVTRKDFIRQTFSVGGHGGGGKDTSNSGVRLIHPPSGAIGEGREHRTNTQNERSAFKKLVQTKEFQNWLKIETAKAMGQKIETPEQIMMRVDKMIEMGIKDGSIKIDLY